MLTDQFWNQIAFIHDEINIYTQNEHLPPISHEMHYLCYCVTANSRMQQLIFDPYVLSPMKSPKSRINVTVLLTAFWSGGQGKLLTCDILCFAVIAIM